MGPESEYTLLVKDRGGDSIGLLESGPKDKFIVFEYEPGDKSDDPYLVGLTPKQARKLAKRLREQADIVEGRVD